MSDTSAFDLAALRQRYQSPPGPCPVCGAARKQIIADVIPVEYWVCGAINHADVDVAGAIRHYHNSITVRYPDSAVIALCDAYEALLARVREMEESNVR